MNALHDLIQQSISAHHAGNFVAAANGYASVLTQDPQNADAWHLAGLLAHQLGNSADGIKQIQLAIDLNPANPEYHSNLAAILISVQQFKPALNAAEQAIALNSAFAPGHHQRGIALSKLNRFDAAIESLELAIQFGADSTRVYNEIANIKQYSGDMPSAVESIERSLDQDPDNAHAYFQLSKFVSAGEYAYSADQIAAVERLLNDPNRHPVDRNRANIAMAVHHEQSENFDLAFRHFQEAAKTLHSHLLRRGLRFNERQRAEIVEDLVDFFQPQVFEKYAAAGNQNDTPVFVVGMPRSGTTLIQQILASHPLVHGAGELTELNSLIQKKFGDASQLRLRDAFKELDGQWITSAAANYLQKLQDHAAPSIDQNRETIGFTRIIDKMPDNYLHLGFVRLLFPKATIINCQRDPRDICLSCFCQTFQSDKLQFTTSNLNYLATMYHNYARLMEHWLSCFSENIYQVVYENLLNNPRQEIGRMLNFLKLDWNDACLNFHETKSSVKTASLVQVRKPFYQTSRGKWRRYEHQLTGFNASIANEIEQFEQLREAGK
jgi:tetratricopeptide (TPR) repeat protein